VRQAFIVSYDISNPKRLRRVYKIMLGYGEHLQLSVFRCELNKSELVELRGKLSKAVHHDEDQVLFVDIGPVDGRGAGSIAYIGRPYAPPERRVVIL
jgi:CRISPR-associated protein Cas2